MGFNDSPSEQELESNVYFAYYSLQEDFKGLVKHAINLSKLFQLLENS